jgi:hypothetical protein
MIRYRRYEEDLLFLELVKEASLDQFNLAFLRTLLMLLPATRSKDS